MLLLQNCKLTPIYWLVMLVDHPQKVSHPLSRLQCDVGSHAPGDAWGACTDLLRRTWKQNIQVKTNFKTKAPNVKMLDLRSTILCRSNLSLISLQAWTMWAMWTMARRHQKTASGPKGLIRTFTWNLKLSTKPKRPHQNFHFQPRQCPNIRISRSTMTNQLSQNIKRTPSRMLRHQMSRKAVFFFHRNQFGRAFQPPAACYQQNSVEYTAEKKFWQHVNLFPKPPIFSGLGHSFWNQQKSTRLCCVQWH